MTAMVDALIRELQAFPELPGVFNPWRDVDPLHDIDAESPGVRTDQLRRYLIERVGRARLVLCAEALGWAGGHFTGIAMTSERILLGNLADCGVHGHDVLQGGGGRRTSRIGTQTPECGTDEDTARTVWPAIKDARLDTRDVVLWNAFALHPFNEKKGLLTNRTPNADEMRAGKDLLLQFLALFPKATVIAIGGVARDFIQRNQNGVPHPVRHPAYGGQRLFRAQFAALFDDGGPLAHMVLQRGQG